MSEEKNTIKEILDYLPNKNTLAKQGLSLDNVDVKQLHVSCEQTSNPENLDIQDFFFLVTKVENKTCHVIPGSFDGVMAGPNDIVLPKNILGQYVYLSLDMQEIVPISSLDKGFAILDNQSFDKVIQAIDTYNQDDKAIKTSFANGMPYISKHDDRIEYHEHQKSLLTKMQLIKFNLSKLNVFNVRNLSKVACFLVVGVLATYFLLHETIFNRKNCEPIASQTTIRGNKKTFTIYSPQQVILSKEPKIVIGGNQDKEYLVSVYDSNKNKIAEQKVQGQSTTFWNDFSDKSLAFDSTYTLKIESTKDKTTLISSKFRIIEAKKAEDLQRQINSLGKSSSNEDGKIAMGFVKGKKYTTEDIYKKAQLLYQYKCYSEAYLEIVELLKDDPQNKDYQKLKKDCLERLNLKKSSNSLEK